MLPGIFESDLRPYVAIVSGFIFIILVRSLYDNDFSSLGYKERFLRRRKLVSRFSTKLFFFIKERIADSWQFLAGIAFAGVIFVGISLAFHISFSFNKGASAMNTILNKGTATNAPARIVIDTTKPWTYDFSTLPDGTVDTRLFNVENDSTKAEYNNELQTFTNRRDNVRIEDGHLILEAQPESRDGKAYTSSRIDTDGSFSFTYGTLEVVAKIPRGVGTWPAAWLMPSNPRYKAADFSTATDQTRLYSLNGELDFLESVGYLPGQNIPALHSYDSLARTPVYTPGFITNPYDEYHRYGVIKVANSVTYTIDGKAYAHRDKKSDSPLEWPFNQPYYLILNLSLGGEWAGKYGIDDASSPWQYVIRSISYTPADATD